MVPADKSKDDFATEKAPRRNSGSKAASVAPVLLLGLIVSAGVMVVWILVNSERVPTRTKIVSKTNLGAYTLLTDKNLMVIPRPQEPSDPKALNHLLDRYLLAKVSQEAEIRPDMLAPPEANALLGNSLAVSIPVSATTLGSQLRVGDIVDLLAVPASQLSGGQPGKPKPPAFENLLVLDVPIKKDPKPESLALGEVRTITLALPAARRDEFASALPGATIVITRRVSVK